MAALSKFTDLYEKEYDAVYAFCARRVGADDAADATADVFAVAWRRIEDVPELAGRPWLFGVARNTVRNRWRSGSRQARLVERVRHNRRATTVGPDVVIERTEEASVVMAALKKLRPPDQEILILSAWDELTGPEIAEVLGISVAAVDQRIHRAKKRLASALEQSPLEQAVELQSEGGEA